MSTAAPLPLSIGIIGGMGPWVDPLVLTKCLEYQAKLGMRSDQKAIPMFLAQFAELIGDRTKYLELLKAGKACPNPAINAATVARSLVLSGARVLGIPCNTFHAEPIFSRFHSELADLTSGEKPVKIVNMSDATIEEILKEKREIRRVGILSTNGTYELGIYSNRLAARGLEAITLPYDGRNFPCSEQDARKEKILGGVEPTQNDVHHAIYNTHWGIKSGKEADSGYKTARAILLASARSLAERKAEAVILGCTEFPLAIKTVDFTDIQLFDPLGSLARALVDSYLQMRSSVDVSGISKEEKRIEN